MQTDIKSVYNSWLNEPTMPEYLLRELKKMNNKLINERFKDNLKFGTGGLRGKIGAGTNAVNIFTIAKTSLGLANYVLSLDNGGKEKSISICYDNRHHSQEFAKISAMVFASKGIKSYLFKDLRPTPMASYAVRYYKCDAGVMVTASHNPKEYNGYKVYNNEGAQLNLDQANKVINEIDKIDNYFNIELTDNATLINYVLENIETAYLKEVHKIRLNKVQLDKNLRLLYSPMHGTGTNLIPKFMKDEGFNLIPYEPHMIINPDFINAKVVNPEFPKAWEGLPKYAEKEKCDLIIITDPDADRVGVSVKHKDDFILLNGNQTATILLYYILSQKKEQKTLPENGYVVSTIVTTDLLKVITESFNQEFFSTLTGFKFIADVISQQKNREFIFGAEESIGSIISSFVRDKDAVQGTLMFTEIASWLKKQNKTLIDYLDQIYKKYGYYLNQTKNIDLFGEEGAKKIDAIMQYFRSNLLQLKDTQIIGYDDIQEQAHYDIVDGLATNQTKIDLPKSNVLKFYLKDGGWITFRPSGTEPKIKIYFECIGQNEKDAEDILTKLFVEVSNIVKNI